MSAKQSRLSYYRDTLLFDLSTQERDEGRFSGVRIKCSQCEALVINGVPTHEHGCPNWARAKRAQEGEDDDG